MKKIIGIVLLSFLLGGIVACEQSNAREKSDRNALRVKDVYGVEYKVIVIEGCEFYQRRVGHGAELTKVDCNCVPDKSGRK